MTHSSGIERRISMQLLAYWEKLRRGMVMPTPEQLDPDDLSDLWDCCFLIHVSELAKPDGKYAYIGPAIINIHQNTIQGDSAPMISPDPRHSAPHFAKVLETGKPLLEEGEFANNEHQVVKYRQCLMPLGKGNEILAIFGGMHFKIYSLQNV